MRNRCQVLKEAHGTSELKIIVNTIKHREEKMQGNICCLVFKINAGLHEADAFYLLGSFKFASVLASVREICKFEERRCKAEK